MDWFEIIAFAEKASDKGVNNGGMGGALTAFLPFILIIAVMYFLMIRPQKKKDKLKQEMLSQLIVGDKILTIGGIHGKIVTVKDDYLIIETGKGTADEKSYIKVARWAVNEVTKPGDEPKDAAKDEASANEISDEANKDDNK